MGIKRETVEGTIEEAAGKAQAAIGEALGDAQMHAEGKIHELKGKAEQAYGKAKEGYAKASEKAKEWADHAPEAAREAREKAQRLAEETTAKARQTVQEQPLAVLAGGVALGFVVRRGDDLGWLAALNAPQAFSMRLRRCHQFDQHARRIARVNEDHRHAVRAHPGFAGAQHGGTPRPHLIAGGDDVRHFETDMMLPAGGVLLQEPVDRRIIAQRLDQFQLAVGDIDEGDAHPLRRQVEGGGGDGGTEQPFVHGDGRIDADAGDADMVEPAEKQGREVGHRVFPVWSLCR